MRFDPFYPIMDSSAWIARLLPYGVKIVQLRIKDQPEEEIRQEIRDAKALCGRYDCILVVNDYWRLAIEEGCSFVHLGQEDLVEADVPAIRRAGLRLGLSSHDPDELETALATAPDYIALGPVYPTVLKKMRFAPQGLDRVSEWKRKVGDIPLVAIGGLTPERARGALTAGADMVSVVTDITLNPDPDTRIREWMDATRSVTA